jgi:hemolysin activation/secretion protein
MPLPEGADIPFAIGEIEVVGSTVFDAATLSAIVAPYENHTVTLAELQAATDLITQQYLNAGYITSRAVLTPQAVAEGPVQIQVIEGGIEDIQIEGSDRLQDYIRVRIEQAGLQPVNQASLEDQLRLLRIDPLFESVQASLRAGSRAGQSRLIVQVTEAPTIGGALFSDNYSPPTVGDVRLGAGIQFRNLAGLGDTLFSSASFSTTEGSKVYELGYRVPISPTNGTLVVRMNPNNFEVTNDDFKTTDQEIRGSTDIYEVIVRQPLFRSPREEFALSLGYRYRNGQTLLGGTVTDATTTNVVTFGQDYVRRDAEGAWSLQSQFRLGEESQGDTILGNGDTSGFFSWIAQVQRVQRLGNDHLLLVQGSLQLAPDALPGSEQFFAGGGLSVRGYDQNQRFGDSGFRISVEDQITLSRNDTGTPFVQLAPFVDMTYVWVDDDNPQVTDNNFMLGTGMGLLVNITDALNARADLAYPLVDIEELDTDNPPGVRFYFSIGYRF